MTRQFFTVLLVTMIGSTGCEVRDPTTESPFQQDACDYVLLLALDCSKSFCEFAAQDGKAYDFALRAIDKYAADRMGGNDQIIITQLSGSQPLLWQGTPHQLRRDFPNRDAFRDYVLSHADQSSSRVNDGVAESLNYVLRTFSVAQGKAKTVALILSDLVDNFPEQEASEKRLIDALTRYARRGAIAFYFCDQAKLDDIQAKTEKAGMKWCIIESQILGDPPLPSFE